MDDSEMINLVADALNMTPREIRLTAPQLDQNPRAWLQQRLIACGILPKDPNQLLLPLCSNPTHGPHCCG